MRSPGPNTPARSSAASSRRSRPSRRPPRSATSPPTIADPRRQYSHLIEHVVRETAEAKDVVIVAHGASHVLGGRPEVLRVFVTASPRSAPPASRESPPSTRGRDEVRRGFRQGARPLPRALLQGQARTPRPLRPHPQHRPHHPRHRRRPNSRRRQSLTFLPPTRGGVRACALSRRAILRDPAPPSDTPRLEIAAKRRTLTPRARPKPDHRRPRLCLAAYQHSHRKEAHTFD